MEYSEFIKKLRAVEKRERQWGRLGERGGFVRFDQWLKITHGVEFPLDVDTHARTLLYEEYQDDMIHMGFLEWDRAASWGVSPYYDLFG